MAWLSFKMINFIVNKCEIEGEKLILSSSKQNISYLNDLEFDKFIGTKYSREMKNHFIKPIYFVLSLDYLIVMLLFQWLK